MSHDSRYLLTARTSDSLTLYSFYAPHDEEALFEVMDLVLVKAERGVEPWATGKVTLTNPVGVVLLTIPQRSATTVDDDGCDYNF